MNLDIAWEELEEEMKSLAEKAVCAEGNFFLYYDFQSKNIMIKDGGLRFIDFQGGRMGPLAYDLASLILDPYVDIEEPIKQELIAFYLDQIEKIYPLDRKRFLHEYPYVAIHRIMQMLGAFGFLSTIKKKRYFADYIPAAVRNLKQMLKPDHFSACRNLRRVVDNLSA